MVLWLLVAKGLFLLELSINYICWSRWCPGPGLWAVGWWGRGRSPDHHYHYHHHHYHLHHHDDGCDLVHGGHQQPEEEHQPALGGAAPLTRHCLASKPALDSAVYREVSLETKCWRSIMVTSRLLTGDRDYVAQLLYWSIRAASDGRATSEFTQYGYCIIQTVIQTVIEAYIKSEDSNSNQN